MLEVVVHLLLLTLVFKGLSFDFETSQIAATLVAMTSNFALNNVLTYYDRRLSGWAWVKGWFSFALASSIGATANVGIATCSRSLSRKHLGFCRPSRGCWSVSFGITP